MTHKPVSPKANGKGEAAALPDGWCMAAIGEVCAHQTENRDPRRDPDAPFHYVDISSVDNQRKVITEARQLPGKEAPSRARQVIRTNDVLVATTRPNLNAVALVPPDFDNEICSTGFCVLRPKPEIEPNYLFTFVQSTAFVRTLSDLVKGALYPAVTDGQVRAQRLPLPPLPEQRRIATRLREQLSAVAQARAAVQTQFDVAQSLPTAHLRAVFEGKNPSKWQRKRIGEIAEIIQNGIYKPAEQYGHGLPFVRMYNVSDTTWKLNLSRLAQVDLEASEQDAFSLRKGDLLVSRVNSFELVGKCAWVGPEAEGYVFENMLIRVRLKEGVDSLLVAQQMMTRPLRDQVQLVAKRAIGQASINSEDLRNLQVLLPPVNEQRLYSATLQSECAAAESLSAALAAKLAALDHLPAALLREAFSGRL